MNNLPKVLEDIIIDYKEEMEELERIKKIDEEEKEFISSTHNFIINELESMDIIDNEGDLNLVYNYIVDVFNRLVFKITELKKYKLLKFNQVFADDYFISLEYDGYDDMFDFVFLIEKDSIKVEKKHYDIFIKSLTRDFNCMYHTYDILFEDEDDELLKLHIQFDITELINV